MSGSEWRAVCCRRAREIDSILRMHSMGAMMRSRDMAMLKKVGIDARTLYTNVTADKTCQLQLSIVADNYTSRALITKEACPYGIWTHVTATLHKNTARIYLNGKLDVEVTLKDSIYLPEASLLLGRGVLEKNKNRNDDNGSNYASSIPAA